MKYREGGDKREAKSLAAASNLGLGPMHAAISMPLLIGLHAEAACRNRMYKRRSRRASLVMGMASRIDSVALIIAGAVDASDICQC